MYCTVVNILSHDRLLTGFGLIIGFIELLQLIITVSPVHTPYSSQEHALKYSQALLPLLGSGFQRQI
jgi:hypothetical protein